MGETMVTQALDERDLLVKKITDKIEKASFVAWIPMMEMLILQILPERYAYSEISGTSILI